LAALCHLKAVQRVAMRPEQPGNEVVLTAKFATLCVKFLPPVLMIAMGYFDVLFIAFTGLFTPALLNVVQRASSPISLESCQEPTKLAD